MKKIKLFSLVAAALFAGSTMAQTVTTGTYSKRTINGEGNTSTWDFTGINTSTESNLNVAEGADEDIYYKPSQAGKIKLYKGGTGLSCTSTSSIYLPVPSGSAGTVTMTCFSTSSGRQFDLYVGGTKSNKNLASAQSSTLSFVSTDITTFEGKTYLLLKDNAAEMKVSSFSIALTVGSYAAACTDAGLLLADNPDIEVNVGETLTAPVLTNPNNVAVTYASSNESVVTVAADGTLTSVGVGDAVITITSASQTVGDVLYCADELTYNVKIKSLSPVLETTESALDFSLNAFETTKTATFTVSGYNLTGEASVSTLPAGFTLDPATLTITDGAVEQAYTLTYAPEAAVEASSADLVFSVGSTSVTIALTYGKIAALTQTIVTDSTTWNWSKAGVKEVLLSDATIPTKNDTIVLANIDGIANDANFNSQALLVRGQYMVRDSKYFQGDYISFNVEKAGTVKVVFSNTANRTNAETETRYLYVNGAKTTAGSYVNNANTTSEEIAVPAGKVEITFMLPDEAKGNQYCQVYSITYRVKEDIGAALNQVQAEVKAVKVIRDGQLLIIREGKTYTAQGVELQ